MMRTALHGVLKDPGFKVTTSAREAQHAASSMLEALGGGEDGTARTAVQEIVSTLATCIRGKREAMCMGIVSQNENLRSVHCWLGTADEYNT